ncbi:unnamed protein product [Lampetra planeri]
MNAHLVSTLSKMSVSRGDAQGRQASKSAPAVDEACDSGIGSLCEADVESIRAGVSRLGVDGTQAYAQLGTHDDDCRRGNETGTQPGTQPGTFLHQAIIHGAPDIALHVLYKDVNRCLIDQQNYLMQTPLHLAVVTDEWRLARSLVLAGANMCLQDLRGNTPLHLACAHQSLEAVWALTDQLSPDEIPINTTSPIIVPSSMEILNYKGSTCLHLAVLNSNVKLVDYLVRKGANIEAKDPKSGRTALHMAVEQDDGLMVSRLVELGAQVNAIMYNGCTPLHQAVGRRLADLAKLLMRLGADATLPNLEYDSPLDLADDHGMSLFAYDDLTIEGHLVKNTF